MSFISSSYNEFPEIEIPTVSEEEHKLVQTLYDTVKGDKKMMIEDAIKILNREKVATVSERNEALDMAIEALEFIMKNKKLIDADKEAENDL